ncbi:MAG: hypothetical protein DRR16_13380 [Candidatus Parabeggiatoa sp. nov. 3]|nr:MAG: hypothetical protein DRR00_05295 [Gammaproteobacteria bacterium]RKZ66431.1 MAG: hypothetical protein DRQ99_09710 [Gammaproteobacteria bacterium]RKZ84911.1 MAG: hypothetical protein DRR16_13380 [Gammaproteobacteria bacterium]
MFELIEMLSVWAGCIISCLFLKPLFFKKYKWVDVLVIMFFSLFYMFLVIIPIKYFFDPNWIIYVFVGIFYPPKYYGLNVVYKNCKNLSIYYCI